MIELETKSLTILNTRWNDTYFKEERPETMVISSERFFLCLVLLTKDEHERETCCCCLCCLSLSCSLPHSCSCSLCRSLSASSVLEHTSSTTHSSVFKHLVASPPALIFHSSMVPSTKRQVTKRAGMSKMTSSRIQGKKVALSNVCCHLGIGSSSCMRLDKCVVHVGGRDNPSGKSSKLILNRTLGWGGIGKSLINMVKLAITACVTK